MGSEGRTRGTGPWWFTAEEPSTQSPGCRASVTRQLQPNRTVRVKSGTLPDAIRFEEALSMCFRLEGSGLPVGPPGYTCVTSILASPIPPRWSTDKDSGRTVTSGRGGGIRHATPRLPLTHYHTRWRHDQERATLSRCPKSRYGVTPIACTGVQHQVILATAKMSDTGAARCSDSGSPKIVDQPHWVRPSDALLQNLVAGIDTDL